MHVTRSDLIERIAASLPQVDIQQVDDAVRFLLEALSHSIASNQRIEIRGFGSFSLHTRAARQGRNPKTGETVNLGKRKRPHFKPGKELRMRVDR